MMMRRKMKSTVTTMMEPNDEHVYDVRNKDIEKDDDGNDTDDDSAGVFLVNDQQVHICKIQEIDFHASEN